jgi:hydroxyethylthiazole kinase
LDNANVGKIFVYVYAGISRLVSLLFCLYIIFWIAETSQIIIFHQEERKMLGNCIENVRKNVPLVHNITNYVTVNDVANVVLACGGSPIMSDDPEDVSDITSICGGLNINIGTLNRRSLEGMFIAGKKANELGHKILLDPVGAGASTLRTSTAVKIMEEIKLDVIRGNISEIKTLALGSGTTKGVDADAADAVTERNLNRMVAFAKSFAKESGSIIAITGAIDLVADADTCYVIRNGRPEMGKITGTGCQLSGMMTAFLVANPDHMLEAAAAAVCTMGAAGEIAWRRMAEGDGNSTYRNRIIDAIYHMDGATLEREAKYEVR